MRAISMSEARAQFASVVKGTSDNGETFVIHNHGAPKAVLMSVEEYRELKATIEEMSDPEARKLLEEGKDDIRKGRTKSAEEIFGESLV